MTCTKVSELLTDFIMGELPPELDKTVKEHLHGCAACRNEHLALKEIIGELQAMAHSIEPPEYLNRQLEQMLVAEIDNSVKNKKRWPAKFIVQIAATFLFVAIGWGVWDNKTGNQQIANHQESANEKAPAAVVLEQQGKEVATKEEIVTKEEAVTEDATLTEQQVFAEFTPETVTPVPEPEIKLQIQQKAESQIEPVAPAEKSIVPPETKSVEILKAEVTDQVQQKQSFTVTQSQTIILETVQQVNIQPTNDQVQVFTKEDNLETIAMIVQGISEALPSEDIMTENEITHIITIQLDTGDHYQLNYCLPKNIGFGEDFIDSKVIIPGASLSLALQNL